MFIIIEINDYHVHSAVRREMGLLMKLLIEFLLETSYEAFLFNEFLSRRVVAKILF
jgi:hypothetical protein